jgi:hypothetical protein
LRGSDYVPPPATGNVFLDVSSNSFAASFIEQFFSDGITGGCGGNNYCPNDSVTRAQMAVFLLRAANGSAYVPPAPTGQDFLDVDLGYWAVAWIEQLAEEGVTSGCGGGNYCPDDPVTRAQMAVFLVRVFGLDALVQVSYVPDQVRAVSGPIDENGGQISTISASGVTMRLDIPAGAVYSGAQFGITPAESVTGLPEGFTHVAAATFSPAGQPFPEIPQITFEFPGDFRNGDIAVAYFTNDSGTQFYLTPMLGPDGRFAGPGETTITLTKSGFSGGGVGLIEDVNDQIQERPIGGTEKNATEEIAKIANEAISRDGTLNSSDLDEIRLYLDIWQEDIARRLTEIEAKIFLGDFTDADLQRGLYLSAENNVLHEWAQGAGVEDDYVTDDIVERLSGVLVDAIAASFALCNSTDEDQLDNSGTYRAQLVQYMQQMGRSGVVVGNGGASIDLDGSLDELFACQFAVQFTPPFTRLPDNNTEAIVTLSGQSYNPITDTLMPQLQGLTFQTLGGYIIEPTDNVSLGIINSTGNTMRFLVSDDKKGSITFSGGRIRSAATVSAELVPDLSGAYTLSYQGSATNCTDPEDNGSDSGSFTITMNSTVSNISGPSSTHSLSGSANGGSLQFSLTETAGVNQTPLTSGSASYTETEEEEIIIDDQTIMCTYTTTASAGISGSAYITDNSVSIDISPTNINSSWTGSPGVCGSGSCSISGTISLVKLSPP